MSSLSQLQIYNTKGFISIESVPQNLSKEQIENAIDKVLAEHDANGFLVLNGSSSNSKSIFAYSFIGNEKKYNSLVSAGKYESFSPDWQINIQPYTEIGFHSLEGTFQIDTDSADSIAVISKNLSEQGIQNSYKIFNQSIYFAQFFQVLQTSQLFVLFIALIIGLFFALSYRFFSLSKQISILRLNGYSNFSIIIEELKLQLVTFFLSSVIVFLLATIYLFFYNSFNLYSDFVSTSLCYFMFLLILIILFNIALFYVFSSSSDLNNFLKGKKRNTQLNFSAIFSEVCLYIILFCVSSNSVVNFYELQKDIARQSEYTKVDNLYSMVLGKEIMNSDASQEFGNFIRELDKESGVMFIERNSVNLGDIDDKYDSGNTYMPSNSIIVNTQYLEAQPVVDSSGDSILNDKEIMNSDAVLIVPDNKKNISERIFTKAKEFLTLQDNNKEYAIKTTYYPTGQTLSNFNNGRDYNNGPMLNPSTTIDDPIILLLPKSYETLSNRSYLSYATRSSILVTSGEALDSLEANKKVQRYITAINNVSDTAISQINIKRTEQFMAVIGLVVSMLVLLLTSFVSVMIYFNKNRHLIFSKYTFGYGFHSAHKEFIFQAASIPLISIMAANLFHLSNNFNLLFIFVSIALVFAFEYFALRKMTHRMLYRFSKV